jgi:argininosuccinate synthase
MHDTAYPRTELSMAKKTVVLVYSGGLDTSICIPMMREEYGYDHVVTNTATIT